jgi:hypothetical protein
LDESSQEQDKFNDTITAGSFAKVKNPPFTLTPGRKEHDMKDIAIMTIAHIVGE